VVPSRPSDSPTSPAFGGKNASLGETDPRALGPGGARARGRSHNLRAYRLFLSHKRSRIQPLRQLLSKLDSTDRGRLQRPPERPPAKRILAGVFLPESLKQAITSAYADLRHTKVSGMANPWSVRCAPAHAEGSPRMQLRGAQQDTFLNIQGEAAAMDACRRC